MHKYTENEHTINAFVQLEIEVSSAVGKFHETYRELGDDSSQSRRHIILIPDKHLHMFPWESVPTLRNQAVSRVPSLFALRDILALHSPDGVLEIDRNNAYYLLNPSQDLANTEKTFKDIIKKYVDSFGWTERKL